MYGLKKRKMGEKRFSDVLRGSGGQKELEGREKGERECTPSLSQERDHGSSDP